MGNEGSGPDEMRGALPAACAVISSSLPMAREPVRHERTAMRIARQVFRLRGPPIVPTFPRSTLARDRSGLSWEIVARYGGATAPDLFA